VLDFLSIAVKKLVKQASLSRCSSLALSSVTGPASLKEFELNGGSMSTASTELETQFFDVERDQRAFAEVRRLGVKRVQDFEVFESLDVDFVVDDHSLDKRLLEGGSLL
jgi:hypothetical protein